MAEEMVEVIVSGEQKIYYKQHRRIPKALYDQYEAMCDAGESEWSFDRKFEDFIDTSDVFDSNEITDVTLELAEPQPKAVVGSPPTPSAPDASTPARRPRE